MRVAVHVHFYVPYRNAGSETMLHAMVKELISAGHTVQVYATVMPEAPPVYQYEGVDVLVTNIIYARQNIEAWKPDVIISHHDNVYRAKNIAAKRGIPFVFICHNDLSGIQQTLDIEPEFVVFNSEWLMQKLKRPGMAHIIVHPPVFAEQHRTSPGSKVTLVNLNANKGSGIFYELARRMPDVEFLAVEGGHGDQIKPPPHLNNVEFVPHTDKMKEKVWSKTKILLMPSVYESYGMAGVEANASGIPVICHPTPGLKESQGPFGLFVDRDDTDRYESEIRRLLKPKEWEAASVLALKRSAELDPKPEMVRWVSELERLVHGTDED
jgi:glycosyltransferase involved in cell wall biosynthesis